MTSSRPPDTAVFLTEAELAARWRGLVSRGTLRNWRSKGRGPPFVKIGKAVLYPLASVERWEDAQLNHIAPGPRD